MIISFSYINRANMFNKIRQAWNDWGYELLIVLCVLFIVIVGLYNKLMGHKGRWLTYNDTELKPYKSSNRSRAKHSLNLSGGGIHPPKNSMRDSKGEAECRNVLQHIFNRPFTNERPDFLNNHVTGNNLELDCYNKDLRLAVEYQGKQHYDYIPFFHSSKDAFHNQKYRDDMKKRICKENGIILIEVPYTVKIEDIRNYLLKELRKYRYIN